VVSSLSSCSVSLCGRLIGKVIRLDVTDDGISVSDRSVSENFSFKGLNETPIFNTGIFGSSLTLTHNDRRIKYRFLKSRDARRVFESILARILSQSDEHISEIHDFFYGSAINNFLRDSHIIPLSNAISSLIRLYTPVKDRLSASAAKNFADLCEAYPIEIKAEDLRSRFEQLRAHKRKMFFDSIESNPLTEQQRLAVIRDNDRNLVLAAAGTGKTSVMVAKALDLVDSGQLDPNEILILAYNKAATVELKERLCKRAGLAGMDATSLPDVFTFHALGRKVLVDSGIKPSISKFTEDPLELKLWVSEWFSEKMTSDPEFMKNFIGLMYIPVNVFDFNTKEEYDSYISDNEYRTLQGELVKGYQELLIANWLFLNSVPYSYEAQYVTKRRIEVEFDYRPDFHISGTDIYIEHFGIARDGSTAPFINRVDYNHKIELKRSLHLENGTLLLETYHHDWTEGNLEARLTELMHESSIETSEKDLEKIFEKLQEKKVFEGVVDRYIKCLSAIRVESLDQDSILSRLEASSIPGASKYQELLSDLHDAYREELLAKSEIDFDDMIIRATEQVDKHEFKPPWRYILVDEFQDISMARMQLLQQLVNNGPEPILTVVGDDWQSIYRFSGGKLELTTRFEELVGSHSLTRLEKTFRYNSSIAHTAGTFIMENPEQYKKNVVTSVISDTPQVYLLDSKIDNTNQLELRTHQIIEKILQNEPDAKIAVLARYNYLLKNVRQHISDSHVEGEIKYWTFHSSKGLEADYCVLIGFFQGKSGFPNQNKEESVVEALLPALDTFDHSEERRLLYVAMTRARKKCYILGDPTAPSEFIIELLSPKFQLHIGSKTFKEQYRKIFKCPHCTTGYYRLMDSEFGKFYSCSSGVSCQAKPRICEKCEAPSVDQRGRSVCNNPNCQHEIKICSLCGRPMKLRDGKYGQFWGCSGYAIKDDQCRHTEKV